MTDCPVWSLCQMAAIRARMHEFSVSTEPALLVRRLRAEPKTLRYRILHAAARLTHGGRRRYLKIAATWPWAQVIVTAWDRITALPQAP